MASYCPTPARSSMHHGGLGISLGICCMAKKIKQPTMQAFIAKFRDDGFDVVIFNEAMIMNEPAANWPAVDCAIMFHSSGFPLDAACEYARLNSDTFFLTDPASQRVLLDRRDFYAALTRNNIPCSKHVFCNRDGHNGLPNSEISEGRDYVVVDGVRIDKPFVEKPCDADDHDVFIYYHSSMGGGCTQLFRKNKNQSSVFVPECNCVRTEGSFIYEAFVMAKDAVDIKCYTVGPNYVHAEARKAPCVDGVVERDDNGKERRVEVQLTPDEMMAARKLTKTFRQMVCGFDMLRAEDGKFYILDVNGWSFVKNHDVYVAKASAIMKDIFTQEVAKRGLHRMLRNTIAPRTLCGVVGVLRHGDRTPKQKVKITLNGPGPLLQAAFRDAPNLNHECVYKAGHPRLDEIRTIIEEMLRTETTQPAHVQQLTLMLSVLSRGHEGLKMQFKPSLVADDRVTQAQVVCKWGGWLTEAGHHQAAMLGRRIAERVFPSREDLGNAYVAVNNERRVMHTALSFMRQFNAHVDPIVDEPLLGDNSQTKNLTADSDEMLDRILHLDNECELAEYLNLPGLLDVLQCPAIDDTERTPRRVLKTVHNHILNIIDHIPSNATLYRNEPIELMRQRWVNLSKGFFDAKKARFDVTKITDIFDYVSYDVCYNQVALAPLDLYPLFTIAELLSAFVSDHECGFNKEQRLKCGSLTAGPLLVQIISNLAAIAKRSAPTDPTVYLYFTSESHVNGLRHILYNTNIAGEGSAFHPVGNPLELHFLSHFFFKIYRYDSATADTPPSYQIEVHFSTGIDKNMFGIVDDHHTVEAAVSPMIRIHNNLDLKTMHRMVRTTVDIFNQNRKEGTAALALDSATFEGLISELNTPTSSMRSPVVQKATPLPETGARGGVSFDVNAHVVST